MRLGVALPHVGPVASRDAIREVAVEAERMGYDSLWALERLLLPTEQRSQYLPTGDGRLSAQYGTVFEHLSVLSYAAAITERVRLGTSVLNVPFYHPLSLAKRVATLDQLSAGRVTLGLGIGWSRDEFAALNVPFARRAAITEEAIAAMKAVWGPDPVSFAGEFFTIPESAVGPKPVQDPHPPLLFGAFAPRAIERAGRLGDGYMGCCAPAPVLADMWEGVTGAARQAGKDPGEMSSAVKFLLDLREEPDRAADETSLKWASDDPGRPVGSGTWDQLESDIATLAAAGIGEIIFDLSFQSGCTDLRTLLGYMERLTGAREMVA